MTPLLSYLLAVSAATVGFLPYALAWIFVRRHDKQPEAAVETVTIPPAEKPPARFS